ncbi:HAD-IA family hydrolase [Aeromicrobium sp.]|nr:HAD-IA family hydrolase [Candidatus Saccharibacteria bacterium]
MANVIFDFDGTIADSFELAIQIFEQVVRAGKPLPTEEIERLRGMSLIHVAIELRIRPWKVPFLLSRGRKMMRQRIDSVKVFEGMPELIRSLQVDGHKLYIVSSNSVQNIRPLLKKHELRTEFIRMYGGAGLLGKANMLRRVLKKQKLVPGDTYYVGDETRDIEAAKLAGIKIISVAWGYNNESILRDHKPDFLAIKPTDIRTALK